MAAILVLFYPLVPSRRGQRALFIFVLPVCIAGLVASAARGPIVALLVTIIVGSVVWLRQGRLQGRTALVLLLLVSAGFGGAYLVLRQANLDKYTGKANEFMTLVSGGTTSGSAGKRLDYYRATLAEVPNHLLLGTGVGSWSSFHYKTDMRNYPHNLFLEIVFEEGLLGLGAFCLFLFVVGLSISRMLHESRWHYLAMALMVFYCVFVSLFSGDLDDNRVLFLWAGVTLTVCRTVRLRTIASQFSVRTRRRPFSPPAPAPAPWNPAYPGGVAFHERHMQKRGRWREKFVY
jgi:O-antigen ligase